MLASPSSTGSLGGNGLIHWGPNPSIDKLWTKPVRVASLSPDPIFVLAPCSVNLNLKNKIPNQAIVNKCTRGAADASNLYLSSLITHTQMNLDHNHEVYQDLGQHFLLLLIGNGYCRAQLGLHYHVVSATVHAVIEPKSPKYWTLSKIKLMLQSKSLKINGTVIEDLKHHKISVNHCHVKLAKCRDLHMMRNQILSYNPQLTALKPINDN